MKYELKYCIGSRLRRLSRIADGHIRRYVSQFGITENQITILFTLYETGKLEQSKIGELQFLERSTISRSMKLLENKELVTRTEAYHPEVELSSKGISLVEELIPMWEKAMDELVEKLSDLGLDSLKEIENKIK